MNRILHSFFIIRTKVACNDHSCTYGYSLKQTSQQKINSPQEVTAQGLNFPSSFLQSRSPRYYKVVEIDCLETQETQTEAFVSKSFQTSLTFDSFSCTYHTLLAQEKKPISGLIEKCSWHNPLEKSHTAI